jgi:two-component system chemotaxis response regulator CheY
MVPRILIADDASFIREILKTLALRQGWKVVAEAVDGDEAASKAIECQPDVIIMDIVMPQLSGIDSAKKILRKFPEMPIIGLSTLDKEQAMVEALEVGFVSYITKPFENWTIITAVNEAVAAKERKSG